MQNKAESLSKDLSKIMKDSANSITEFEKALMRKTEECDVSLQLDCNKYNMDTSNIWYAITSLLCVVGFV